MSDPESTLERFAAKAGQLYSLPAVAMEVLELTNNPQVDAHALKECIETDPALTVKVLRVVNSSLYGLSREVSDLNQAVALLGTKPLKLLVLGFSLPPGLFSGVVGDVLLRYWRHTLIKAVTAREISEAYWQQSGDEAFIAGLLQDVGILVLIQDLGEPYVKFLEKVLAKGGDLVTLETESMGFDHTMLTAKLLKRWKLPDALTEAVCLKNLPDETDTSAPAPRGLPQVLRLAELVARFLADGQADVLNDLLLAADRCGGLSQQQLEELINNLDEKVQQLADALSLELPQDLDYRDLLIQAHTQLAEVAAEVAEDLIQNRRSGGLPRSETEGLTEEFQELSDAIVQASQGASDLPPPDHVSRTAPQPTETPPQPADVPHRQTATAKAVSTEPVSTHSRQTGTSPTVSPDPGILGQLAASVGACRQSRCALSLLLAELDHVNDLVLRHSVEGFNRLRNSLESACHSLDHPSAICLPYREAGFAVILPDCERQPAVQLGNHLIDQVRRLGMSQSSAAHSAVSVSVGAATVSLPPNNFPPKDLLTGADRCLYGSHASGGSMVKSIEIY